MEKEEMTTMAFSFGPNDKFTLYIPMKKSELLTSIKNFTRALVGASHTSFVEHKTESPPAEKQLGFGWSEPICGGVSN